MRIRKEVVLLGIAAVWLFVGCDGAYLSHYSNGLYLLMDLFVAYTAIQALTLNYQPRTLIAVALIYQPFLKLHLGYHLWNIVDVITGIYMIWLIIRISFSKFFESVVFPKLRKNKIHLLVIWSIWLLILVGGSHRFYFWRWLLEIPTLISIVALLICIDELQPKE